MERQDGREIKILILCKTGSGKSATGNTILNKRFFEEDCPLESANTRSLTKTRKLDDVTLQVTDTPGIFNTRMTETEIINQIKIGLELSHPGVHIILLVIRLNTKFTQEESKAVEFIQKNLGQKARKHIMVLFTHGDALEKAGKKETHLYRCQSMKKLVDECNSVYHVFNNKSRDQTQVEELLEKIDQMIWKNGDQLYTTEMFEKVQQNKVKSEQEKAENEREEAQSKRDKAETMSMSILMGLTGLAVGGLVVALFKK